jgi:hypothetical protein
MDEVIGGMYTRKGPVKRRDIEGITFGDFYFPGAEVTQRGGLPDKDAEADIVFMQEPVNQSSADVSRGASNQYIHDDKYIIIKKLLQEYHNIFVD